MGVVEAVARLVGVDEIVIRSKLIDVEVGVDDVEISPSGAVIPASVSGIGVGG